MFGEGFKVKYALIDLAAWPYARALRYSTIQQAEEIRLSNGIDSLESALSAWTISKEKELKYIAVAATVSAGANVSVFSWNDVPSTIWYARALWYMSLIFSIMTLISIVQVAVMVEDINHYLTGTGQKSRLHQVDPQGRLPSQQRRGDPSLQAPRPDYGKKEILRPNDEHSCIVKKSDNQKIRPERLSKSLEQCISLLLKRRCRPQRQPRRGSADYLSADWTLDGLMLFVWQSPMMFASYSWVVFLLALALHVIKPLLERAEWSDDYKIAITFLCVFFASLAVCMWCAWFPHYKRLKIGSDVYDQTAAVLSPEGPTVPQTHEPRSVPVFEPVKATLSDLEMA